MHTPSPDDSDLAAWLAGDLDDVADAAVAATVRDDPDVARRADRIAAALARLASATTPPNVLAEARHLDVVGALGKVEAPPPVDVSGPQFGPLPWASDVTSGWPRATCRTDVGPQDRWPAGRTSKRGAGAGRRRGVGPARGGRWLDRVLPGTAVMLVVVVVSAIGVQTFRDGPGLSPSDPGDEPAGIVAADEGGTDDEAGMSGAPGSSEGPAGDLAVGGAAADGAGAGAPSEEELSEGARPVDDGLDPGPASSVGGPGAADGTGQTPGTGASAAGPPVGTEPPSGQQPGGADQPSSLGDPFDEDARQPGAGPEQPAEGGQPPVGGAAQPGVGAGSPEGVDQPAREDDASAEGGDEAPNPVPSPSPVTPDPVDDDTGGQEGAPLPPPPAPPPPSGDDGGGADDDASSEPPPSSPTVRDSMVGLADEAAVRAWFGDRSETTPLLGLTAEQAQDRAAIHAQEIRASAPFASGVHPGACLDAVAGGPTVVAAVESATYAGQPSLTHLVVTGTDTLDTARAIITDPATCTIRLTLEVPT